MWEKKIYIQYIIPLFLTISIDETFNAFRHSPRLKIKISAKQFFKLIFVKIPFSRDQFQLIFSRQQNSTSHANTPQSASPPPLRNTNPTISISSNGPGALSLSAIFSPVSTIHFSISSSPTERRQKFLPIHLASARGNDVKRADWTADVCVSARAWFLSRSLSLSLSDAR